MLSTLLVAAVPWFSQGLPPVGSWDYRDVPVTPIIVERKKKPTPVKIVYPTPSEVVVPVVPKVKKVVTAEPPIRKLEWIPIPVVELYPEDIINRRRAREKVIEQDLNRLRAYGLVQ